MELDLTTERRESREELHREFRRAIQIGLELGSAGQQLDSPGRRIAASRLPAA